MWSIRSKITIVNIIGIALSLIVASVIAGLSVADFGHENSEAKLSLLCNTGKSSLNYYFKSVEQSVDSVGDLLSADMKEIADLQSEEAIAEHIQKADTLFKSVASHTSTCKKII